MKLHFSIPGLFLLSHNEFKRLAKGSIYSYCWFVLLIIIAVSALFSEEYADLDITVSIMGFKYGEAPMTDILIFYSSSFISSISDTLPPELVNRVFPVSIGIAFFIIFPFFLGLILISKFIIAKATASIASEKEKKTLYLLTVSPHERYTIFLGKFLGMLLLTLPMVLSLYFITHWIFSTLFFPSFNSSIRVLETASVTALLFASIGMFVSVLTGDEKKASWRGLRILIAMAALTALWVSIPFAEFVLNLTNKSAEFLPVLEKITFISPFTMDLMSVYDPAIMGEYLSIQLIASVFFLILGLVIFMRQDIEY